MIADSHINLLQVITPFESLSRISGRGKGDVSFHFPFYSISEKGLNHGDKNQ
jgi:hypothetical protein